MRISDWSSDVCSSDIHDVLFSFSLSRNVPGKPVWLFSETESPNGTSGIGPPNSKIWRKVLMTVVNKDEIEDRKSTRRTPVTNAHIVCLLLLVKNKYMIGTITRTVVQLLVFDH